MLVSGKEAKTTKICSMRAKDGQVKSEMSDIANVFADCYADLYSATEYSRNIFKASGKTEVHEVTEEEITRALKRMKNGETSDGNFVVVEMLKSAGRELRELIASMFTEIMRPQAQVPEAWRKTVVKVLFKKGDELAPGNYRPISILPILYKLFARIICSRITKVLEEHQSCDQAGFRSGFSVEDHLLTISILAEMQLEADQPLWISALDFQTAFDSITHESLWDALWELEVHENYIETLSRLYAGQTGVVNTGIDSKTFKISKGTRQGDPVSPVLFNAVSE